jgi:hypothetical protein
MKMKTIITFAWLLTAVIMTGCTSAPAATTTQFAMATSATQPITIFTESAPDSPLLIPATSEVANSKAFPGTFILGRPTTDSITLSLLATGNIEIFVQYGKASGKYDVQTSVSNLQRDQPQELKITGLNKDTQYYYRLRHRLTGETDFSAGVEGTFHSQRTAGGSFVFTVEADPHFDNNTDPAKLKLTFQNILNEHPDLDIDLGDTFMTEKLAFRSFTQVVNLYATKRNDFNIFSNSVPIFLALGNHDGESGGALNGTENNIAVWASKARQLYYPNPYPDGYYSGNTKAEPFIGLRGNYFAWEWGDALFVVLDPYWYSQGGKNSTGWNLTLGKEQYDWLKSTLEKSQAIFKFVFAHNLVGGFDLGSTGNMRGGTEAAGLYEWGGKNTDGTWGFDKNRPGWGKPIHQLLVDNHVTIFFHGHDHFFGRQELAGVVYQECPQPGSINEQNHAAEYGYKTGTFLDGAGHIRVTVSSDQVKGDFEVKVDYISSYLPKDETLVKKNGQVAFSYTIQR